MERFGEVFLLFVLDPRRLECTLVSGVAHTLIGLFSHPAFFMAGPRITEVSLFCAGGMIFNFQGPPSSFGLLPVWDIAPCCDNSVPENNFHFKELVVPI